MPTLAVVEDLDEVGHQRSLTVQRSRRSPALQLKQLGQRRQAIQIVVPKVSGRHRRAADGQQPVFVTTGECARKLWRIMTADSGIDGR